MKIGDKLYLKLNIRDKINNMIVYKKYKEFIITNITENNVILNVQHL